MKLMRPENRSQRWRRRSSSNGEPRTSGSSLERTSRRDCELEFGSRGATQAFDDETGTIGERLAAHAKNAKKCLQTLPKQMSGLYSRIKARIRDGVAVAEARNRSCTACFMSLRPQVMAEIRRGEEVLTCDNCGRILYFVPTDSIQADAAAPHLTLP